MNDEGVIVFRGLAEAAHATNELFEVRCAQRTLAFPFDVLPNGVRTFGNDYSSLAPDFLATCAHLETSLAISVEASCGVDRRTFAPSAAIFSL